jgi:hypothetical protein
MSSYAAVTNNILPKVRGKEMTNRFSWQFVVWGLIFWLLVSCAPPTTPVSQVEATAVPTSESVEEVLGCVDGGPGVFTPNDVRCYLAFFAPEFVWEIDEETAVLFTDPNSRADWVGGAIIYHIPTVSSLVLDSHGDVDPQFSHINNRAALVAFSQLAADAPLLAELKQTVQQHWQTTDSGEPEVRLGLAWQDGVNTIFMIALAGLPANDNRFYCPGETWTIGDEETQIISDCITLDEDTLIHHLIFTRQEVRGSQPLPVQVALNDVASNRLRVVEGKVSLETAVYQPAIIYATGGQAAMLRGETTTNMANAESALSESVDPTLLQNFLAANQTAVSLDFLFLNHRIIFPQPGWVVERDYLPATDGTPNCTYFDREFSGLKGGVVTLSQIGFSEDGSQAVLFLQQECGAVAIDSSYLLLELQGDYWHVIDEFGQVEIETTTLQPSLAYNGRSQGCGDIFVYKANSENAMSEYITMGINARNFPISAEPITLALADYPEDIVAKIDLFGDRVSNVGEFPYCNDISQTAEPVSVWQAESGQLTISINGTIPEESCAGDGYEATLRLENSVFRNGEETVTLDGITFENVMVGWCAG